MTREELALLLENEAHLALAERIRAGSDPIDVLSDGHGNLRKALRRGRYRDHISANARATFWEIVQGMLVVQ